MILRYLSLTYGMFYNAYDSTVQIQFIQNICYMIFTLCHLSSDTGKITTQCIVLIELFYDESY